MRTTKIILSVLAGAFAGAAVGILYAPQKGKKTRRKIMNKGDEYMTDIENVINGYMDMIHKKMENMKLEITHTTDNGKAKIADAVSALTDRVKS